MRQEFFRCRGPSALSNENSLGQREERQPERILAKKDSKSSTIFLRRRLICLWGEPAQVLAAEELLQQLISKCKASFQKKKTEWAKINAYSSTKEVVIDRREKHEVIIQQLRRAPDPSVNFPERLLFLWPAEELPMKDFLGPDLGALDFIRAEFGYHLYIPEGFPDYICVAGHDHDVIREIVRRLRTKWSELMASANIRSKVYLVEPPEIGRVRTEIVVKNSPPFAKPFLYGDPLKEFQLVVWRDRAPLIRSKNDIRLLNATERSLRGLPFFRGHLRMRVNLGSFVLDEYRLPRDAKPAYSFEEFREMLLNDSTKGRLVPGLEPTQTELLDRCFKASHILAPIPNTARSLADAEPAYSVNFEFSGADSALLRLEAEFSKHHGAEEYEVTQRRWVKPQVSGQSGDKRPPLQIAVIDFERSDWQLEIKALEFYDKSTIDGALKSFSHSIGFRKEAAVGGISATPRRKVKFPESVPVSRVVEKTALRFKIKGTEYTLEIARYDEYSRMGIQVSQGCVVQTINPNAMPEVPITTWGASIYDLSWDNLLGQQANMGVGHAASWNPNLNTFFRPKNKVDPADTSSGFWKFIALVKEIAELLGPRKAGPPKKAQSDAANNKVTARDIPPSVTKPKTAASHVSSSSSPTADRSKKTIELLNADLGTLF
ncbi:hypothetical protein VTN00DRAFT_9808 [Thermoascus crustaceus]|uniref:uncharacterized protein n=1 Tax=Thermoascus crustaceus TaxID=5088 RepID=UPI0037441032